MVLPLKYSLKHHPAYGWTIICIRPEISFTGDTKEIVVQKLLNIVAQSYDGPVEQLYIRGPDISGVGEIGERLSLDLDTTIPFVGRYI